MGKLYKNAKKYSVAANFEKAVVGEETRDALHPLGESTEQAYDAKKAAEKAVKDAENAPIIPVADEEELRRARRRRPSGGGRASTVLSSYGEGFGG